MFKGLKIGIGVTGSFCSLSHFMDFLKEKYPQVIMDFIKGPYDFEKN